VYDHGFADALCDQERFSKMTQKRPGSRSEVRTGAFRVENYAVTFGADVSAGRAAFAVSTMAANVAGSLTARSARMRRSTSIPARFRPWIRRL
jgi:hypothetical protein